MNNKKSDNIFVQGAISASFIAESIQKHSIKKTIGAHSIFLGQVRRDEIDGKIVDAIEFTSYEEMAIQQANRIKQEMFEKYPLSCMHIYHSLGKVGAGEICLFVFTSSVHRQEAVSACSETVERIKKELPVWGKELFEDASHKWKENT